ncbi:N-acetylmannosamine-6-phosphate 2-epimerase [Clostridium sp. AN503]|uniref:N-acetylmannosamine-6-phosphate 2-epimerase n=1 Tax=Clostridium sp. AN503 TaxID=3160598 RepID=UPI003459EA23
MNQANQAIMDRIKGGLIVSCQALKEEPLYSSYIMSRMAYAAMLGGAVGIRANTIVDITEIKKTVSLPVIGIIKEVYGDCDVYISPTMKEIDALVECGVSIIATDATDSAKRPRPDGKTLDEFFGEVREKYPDQLFMADCSSYEEGMHAAEIGFDLVGTTMNGYTEYTKGVQLPNIELMRRLSAECGRPVIAEGGIWQPDQLKAALDAGVWAAVIGGAITRPMEITKRFVTAIK